MINEKKNIVDEYGNGAVRVSSYEYLEVFYNSSSLDQQIKFEMQERASLIL